MNWLCNLLSMCYWSEQVWEVACQAFAGQDGNCHLSKSLQEPGTKGLNGEVNLGGKARVQP